MNACDAPVRPLRILLIEDSLMDINLFKIALSRRNSTSQLTTIKDGEKAMLHLRSKMGEGERPDLTVLDLNLPRMDGMEVLSQCKNDPLLRSIPVVVFTSTQSPIEVGQCYDLGAVKVITKPGELEPFLGAVQGIEDCLRRNLDSGADLGNCMGGPN